MINNEIKFLLLIIFIIFMLILLIGLIILITFVRFNCQETINFMKNIKFAGNIEDIYPKLKTGDIILFTDTEKVIKNNLDCFKFSRANFTPENYSYQHIGLVYRNKQDIFIIESNLNNGNCGRNYSLTNKNYHNGVKITSFHTYFTDRKQSEKKYPECKRYYAIRFLNPQINQTELNNRIQKEFRIIDGTPFHYDIVAQNGTIGWIFQDLPIESKHSIDTFLPMKPNSNTYFCSEVVATLLQRCGIMKLKIRPSIFFPSYFSGFMDDKIFYPNTYSKIFIFK